MSVLFPLLLLLSSLTLSALAQATCSAAMAPYILPSLNTTQKLAISSPPQGAEVFDTTQNALSVYNGTTWQMLNPSFPDGLTVVGNLSVEGSLTMTSTTQALVPPTMNTTQKTAIDNPPQGGVVFDTTQGALNVYSGTAWQPFMTSWQPFTTTITATTTNPTISSGAIVTSYYMVYGKMMFVYFTLYQTGGGTGGDGTYLFSIPPGFTFNSGIVTGYNGDSEILTPVIGSATLQGTQGYCFVYSTTTYMISTYDQTYASSTSYVMSGANSLSASLQFPID
jgi:hypothetical protein